MNDTPLLTVCASQDQLAALTPLGREGLGVRLTAGRTLRDTLTEDLRLCPDCVEQRIQTIFLDGSPVDDIDADQARPGCALALAGALPGVAGIAMRRGSPVGVFREGITHHAQAAAPTPATFPATLKLFNSVAVECLVTVLTLGVEIPPARLAELLAADPGLLDAAAFTLNREPLDRAALIAALRALPGPLRLEAIRMHQDLATLADIAEAAGIAIMDVRRAGFDVVYKDDHSPLTRADQASHEVITRALAQAYPDIPVLSEEGKDLAYAERAAWKRLFIVDPLDGTKEFVKELGEFCVCIALAEDGFPTLGAVHVPVWNKTYVGGLGLGAFRREAGGPWTPIAVRKPDPQALVILASRSHPSPELETYLADKTVAERITAGSALKFCLVAEGRADLYPRFNPTREWDTAAGQAVVEGAGGSVVRFPGGVPGPRLPVNKEDLLNGPFLASAAQL